MSLHDETYDEISEIMFEDKGTSLKIHFLVKEIRIHPMSFLALLNEKESKNTIDYDGNTGESNLYGFPLIMDTDVEDWMVVTK